MIANDATSETFFVITGANLTNFAIYLKKNWPKFSISQKYGKKKQLHLTLVNDQEAECAPQHPYIAKG